MLSKRLCLNLTVDTSVSIISISCYHILAILYSGFGCFYSLILYSGLGCFYSLIFYGKTKRCNSYVDMVEFRILYSWLPWMRGKRYIYLTICHRRYFLPQFLRQRCMSTHCFQSLYQLGPGSLWCIPKPPAKNFNLAALGIMRVVTLNSSQCVQSEFQLHPQLVPLCHILQFILNLPQCQTSRGSCYGEVSL